MKARLLAITLSLLATAGAAQDGAVDPSPERRLLEDALTVIQENFVTPMTREELEVRALRALLADLDPYASYLDPAEWKTTDADLRAEFAGVGVVIGPDEKARGARVERLLIGSAAGAAGIRRDDVIVSIDGWSLRGASLDEVFPRLRGEPGSRVALGVVRADSGSELTLRVTRAVVKTPSVRGTRRNAAEWADYLLDEAEGVGYIRISRLADDTVPEVERALARLSDSGARGLILDLRDSGGGLMKAAVGVADLLLEEGRILTSISRGEETLHYDATPGGVSDLPLVVLVNGRTASSSEFLAAALKDNARGRLLGERTFGKGRIQRRIALPGGESGLVLTTGRFQRPSGVSVDRHDGEGATAGVEPDETLVVDGAEYDTWAEHAALLDSPVVFDDDVPAPPDRVLERARTILATRAATRYER